MQREHVLSKDCWCSPKVVSYAKTKKKGKRR